MLTNENGPEINDPSMLPVPHRSPLYTRRSDSTFYEEQEEQRREYQRERAFRGQANKLRGQRYATLAQEFLDTFPKGTQVLMAEFDAWCEAHGLYVNQSGQPKDSDAWMAMLHRRGIWLKRLNKAAAHPRRHEENGGAYFIQHEGQHLAIVEPSVAIGKHKLAQRIDSLMVTQRIQFRHLIESQDWTQVPPILQSLITMHDQQIDNFEDNIHGQARGLEKGSRLLIREIKRLAEAGTIGPLPADLQAS